MSATFWNMRRRAATQKVKQQEHTVVDKPVDKPEDKPAEKAKRGRVKKNDV